MPTLECSPIDNPMAFALAGAARFTLVSKSTGTRFTFKVKQSEDNATMHFVSCLTGPDNWSNYSYLGFIRRGVYFHGGSKAKIGVDAPSAKAFNWFWRNLSHGGVSSTMEIYHCGACAKCGRSLTTPKSIKSGYGPDCREKMGLT